MTSKQQKDIETVKYFIPEEMKHIEITDKDIEMFLEWSEKGMHKEKKGTFPYKMDGFNALVQGKEWRGIHMKMYEEGILDCSMPYSIILENKPLVVIEFMKKEMFKGKDAKIIDNYLKR